MDLERTPLAGTLWEHNISPIYMELNIAYHQIKAEEFKVQEYKTLAKKADCPQVETAYNVLAGIHLSTMTGLQTQLVYKISTLISPPAKPEE